jgi:WD40 repeat protein
MVDDLVAKSLMRRDDQENLFLHDLQYDYIKKQVNDLPARHQRWLDAYRIKCKKRWKSCPQDCCFFSQLMRHLKEAEQLDALQDGYFFSQLTRHLKEAGQLDELRTLLFDYDWLWTQLNTNGINSLLADYDWMPDDKTLKLLQNTLQLSAHVLVTKPTQLTERLWGHLRDREEPEFGSLLSQGSIQQKNIWLQPHQAKLTPPDGPLLRTFEGHSVGVRSVVLSKDGRYVLSGADDKTLKLWDVKTGEVLRTFEGHSGWVMSVVLSADSRRALSGSYHKTLKLWDMKTGEALCTFEGHSGKVYSVAVS